MKLQRIALVVLGLSISSVIGSAQTITKRPDVPQFVKASPAYAEVLLRRTELEADLEDLLVAYTLEYPKVIVLRYRIDLLNAEMLALSLVKQEESSKLTLALGKLMVRKTDLQTELLILQKQYNDDHPDVKKIKRKILVFESAIKDVLL